MGPRRLMQLSNALTRKEEALEPSADGLLRYYSCGPTVYDEVHIGNLRAFIFYDLLKRALKYLGYRVKHVMNVTDVDDKTIRRSRVEGVSLRELTDRYIQAFEDDLEALRIEKPDVMPRATEYISDMISMIQRLEEKGLCYRAEDGSVYFAIGRFPQYGQLIDLEKTELQAGASQRVHADEYEKESVADFALWKAWSEDDGDVAWDSPWGRGRPGWHLECSAMALDTLGESIDLHTGGIDLKFPHHENEIAQSEGASGQKFCHCFAHNKHLLVNGEKMSKSKANFYTRRQLAKLCNASGRELRYALLKSHYGRELNFQATEGSARFESIEEARAALERWDDAIATLERRREEEGGGSPEVMARIMQADEAFEQALAADLNISGALAAVFELLGWVHSAGVSGGGAAAVLGWLRLVDGVLALWPEKVELPPELQDLLAERAQARADKDWKRSDEIREEFRKQGWDLRDVSGAQSYKRLS